MTTTHERSKAYLYLMPFALWFSILSFLSFLFFACSGCGKKIALDDALSGVGVSGTTSTSGSGSGTGGTGDGPGTGGTGDGPGTGRQGNSVDLLWVIDTSCQMDENRSKLAASLSQLFKKLDPRLDLRTAVLLGHGGASSFSGKLYAEHHWPKVLGTDRFTLHQIEEILEHRITDVPRDRDEADGRALLYSLNQSLMPGQVEKIRKHDFYRKSASLAVIFVTDRSDLCFPPELHGYTQFPDYVPIPGNSEHEAYLKYCVDANTQTPTVTPPALYSSLIALKGQSPLSLGALIHIHPSEVPQNNYDSIGHGILELVQLNANRVLLDLSQKDISPFLKLINLGQGP